MAAVNKNYLDYSGLTHYDSLNKEYINDADEALDERIQVLEAEVVSGIDIRVDSSGTKLMIGYVYDKRGELVEFTFSGSSLLIG